MRGFHGAPIIEPYDSVVIGVNEDRTIECKAKEPVTWVSEVYIINKISLRRNVIILLNFRISKIFLMQ